MALVPESVAWVYTGRLIGILPPGIRYAIYADDLFLYARSRVFSVARDPLSGALDSGIPWLRSLGWGITPSLLLVAYRNLVRSTLEWGSPLFSSASQVTLRLLDRAQYMALRGVLVCMR